MGNLRCSKEKKAVNVHELAFMSAATEGCYGQPALLDAIYEKACMYGFEDQIFQARDRINNEHAIHKAAMHGNPTVLEWIIKKWKEAGICLNIDEKNEQSYTPLFLACQKGF